MFVRGLAGGTGSNGLHLTFVGENKDDVILSEVSEALCMDEEEKGGFGLAGGPMVDLVLKCWMSS